MDWPTSLFGCTVTVCLTVVIAAGLAYRAVARVVEAIREETADARVR